jgi:hypothetical protein
MAYTGIWGDSVAVGLQQAAGLGGIAKEGLSPSKIADILQQQLRQDPRRFQGSSPLISTGIMNDPSDWQGVSRIVDTLAQAGANPTFIGGAKGRYDEANKRLRNLVSGKGFKYAGDFTPGSDSVHPANYQSLYSQISSAPQTTQGTSRSSGTERTIVDIAKYLQRYGLNIGEHPQFGGVSGAHTTGSFHYAPGGEAIDVRDWRPDVAPAYEGGKPIPWKQRTGELAWRAKKLGVFNEALGPGDRGHDTHVHLALTGKRPMTDQQLEWLATGRYKTQEGTLTDVMPGEAQPVSNVTDTTLPLTEGEDNDLLGLLSLLQTTQPKQKTFKESLQEQVLAEALTPVSSIGKQFLQSYMSSPLPGPV